VAEPGGAVGDEALAGLGDVQHLALELKLAGQRVVDVLEHRTAHLDLVLGPHVREPRRERQHLGDRAVDGETDLDAMREVYETNVFGVILVTNAMLALLRRAPAARIVNVSSEVGSITSMTDPASPLTQLPAGLAYPSSKSELNMTTAMYAKELRDTPIKVNAANPGYTATDLNGHSGFRSVAEGAEASVRLATLAADGPSGMLWGHLWTADGPGDAYGPLSW
jgi:NAD(P)-dependent dehydrogenase (short-subunit alcohol dehydrogenase family)